MKNRKILAFLLSFLMVVTMFPNAVFAAGKELSDQNQVAPKDAVSFTYDAYTDSFTVDASGEYLGIAVDGHDFAAIKQGTWSVIWTAESLSVQEQTELEEMIRNSDVQLSPGNGEMYFVSGVEDFTVNEQNGGKYFVRNIDGTTYIIGNQGKISHFYYGNYKEEAPSEKTSVSGTKTWIDPEGTVHPEITIVLKRDGAKVDEVTLANGETTYSFTNLDVYAADGHAYEYTVEELPVEGYTSSQDGYNFTNTINQEKTSVSGTKTWIDPEGTVHPDITIVLKRDGVEADRVTLGNGETTYSFDDLDVYAADGHVYEYTVEENSVEGYTSQVNGYDIVNTVEQKYFDIRGMKIWENVPEGETLPEITVILYKNGVEIDRAVVSEATYWEYAFEGMEQYDLTTGQENVYTVDEVPVEGYETEINGYDITNTYATEEIPDENTPLDPPEENIPDEDTPLNPPEENIPDEDTPLGPATGQAENLLPVALAAVSATALFVLTIARKKTVKE